MLKSDHYLCCSTVLESTACALVHRADENNFLLSLSKMSDEIKICLTCGRYEFTAGRAAVRVMEKAISFDCEESSLYALLHTSETLRVFSLIFSPFFISVDISTVV